MTRNIPVLPTIFVLAACVTMVALGLWQWDRASEKEALIARSVAAQKQGEQIIWPDNAADAETALYRLSKVECVKVWDMTAVAGTSATGAKGWAHRANCLLSTGNNATIAMGWSNVPQSPEWAGGVVSGTIAPGPRLVADPAVAGLQPLAKPDPADLPNNHLAYTGQWFFFALTALVIYVLALRRRKSSHEAQF